MIEFWKSLTEAQAHLLVGLLQFTVVPLFVFLWANLKIQKVEQKAEQAAQKAEATNKDFAGSQRDDTEQAAVEADSVPAGEATSESWNQLKAQWERVRDKLFSIAFAPSVDGRKRAAYKRIDLRGEGYKRFIAKLEEDGLLGPNKLIAEGALKLWTSYRTNRASVTADAIKQMTEFANRL